jgi:hypothetical protein
MFGKWFKHKDDLNEQTDGQNMTSNAVALLPGRMSVFPSPSSDSSSLYHSLDFLRGVIQNRLAPILPFNTTVPLLPTS